MLKNGKRVGSRRKFSDDFKLKVVGDYETGTYSVNELMKFYDLSNSMIYRWIYKYSKYNKRSVKVVELKDSNMNKFKEMEARIAELERALGQKQMNIDYLEKMIDLAGEEFDIDIKKNFDTPRSGGFRQTGTP